RVVGLRRPFVYYDHLNNIAAELLDMGRVGEAWRVIRRPMASSLAAHYPNWRETASDIAARMNANTRKVVSIVCPAEPLRKTETALEARATRQVETMLERRRAFAAETTSARSLNDSAKGPAKVLDFLRWKSRIEQTNPQPAQSTPAQRALMTTSEKLLRIVDLICRDETEDRLLDKVLRAVEQIVFESQKS